MHGRSVDSLSPGLAVSLGTEPFGGQLMSTEPCPFFEILIYGDGIFVTDYSVLLLLRVPVFD